MNVELVLQTATPTVITEEDAKKLENAEAIAVDGNPIHHLQGGPQ